MAKILPLEAKFRTLTAKGISQVEIASPKLQTSDLMVNKEALHRCQTALGLKGRSDSPMNSKKRNVNSSSSAAKE
jgi:hypothetical protein